MVQQQEDGIIQDDDEEEEGLKIYIYVHDMHLALVIICLFSHASSPCYNSYLGEVLWW